MQTTQLANGFAVRIEGVDLSTSLDDETFDAIRTLWMEYRVAVYSAEPRPNVRSTPLTEEESARIPDCTHPLIRTHPYAGNG